MEPFRHTLRLLNIAFSQHRTFATLQSNLTFSQTVKPYVHQGITSWENEVKERSRWVFTLWWPDEPHMHAMRYALSHFSWKGDRGTHLGTTLTNSLVLYRSRCQGFYGTAFENIPYHHIWLDSSTKEQLHSYRAQLHPSAEGFSQTRWQLIFWASSTQKKR